MSVFRRSVSSVSPIGTTVGRQIATPAELDVPSRYDTGPILVAVDGKSHGWDALEWSAAEAAARRCTLRILHVANWAPQIFGDYAGFGFYPGERDSGEFERAKLILEEAVHRAHAVAPGLSVITRIQEGSTASAVVLEGKRDALIVMGRGHKGGRITTFARSISMQVMRQATTPVVIVELFDRPTRGPSARRVVVGVSCAAEPLAVLAFAFRAALRRNIGLTILHASGTSQLLTGLGEGMNNAIATEWVEWQRALRTCRETFPDVNVRQRFVEGPVVPALITESEGAALVVIGSEVRGRLHGIRSESAADCTSRLAHSPVAIVGCRQ